VIGYLASLAAIAIGLIALIIAVCFVFIVGFTIWQITKRITEGIERGMNDGNVR
jgi:hypothetical protein